MTFLYHGSTVAEVTGAPALGRDFSTVIPPGSAQASWMKRPKIESRTAASGEPSLATEEKSCWNVVSITPSGNAPVSRQIGVYAR